MILYHGTSARALPSILRQGIRPRKAGRKGNWPGIISSYGNVYLSQTFALWYCLQFDEGALIKIDASGLDFSCWHPDEDFIFKIAKRDGDKITNKEAKQIASNRPDLAMLSLDHHGTIAYKGCIPKEAIIDHVLTPDPTKIIMGGYDPVVGLGAHKFLGHIYRRAHEELFEEKEHGNKIAS